MSGSGFGTQGEKQNQRNPWKDAQAICRSPLPAVWASLSCLAMPHAKASEHFSAGFLGFGSHSDVNMLHVCTHTRVHVRKRTWAHACVCAHAVCLLSSAHMLRACMGVHTHLHVCACTCTCMWVCTYMHAGMHVCVHPLACTCMCTHASTRMNMSIILL